MTPKLHKLYDGDTFEHAGRTFRVRYEPDTDAALPWDECDGHGVIRKAHAPHYDGRTDKRPGERPMNQPGRNEWQFYYDWAATTRKARAEGWGLGDGDWWKLAAQVNGEPTAGQVIAESVRRDFEFCSYCISDDMPYVGVIVELLGPEDEEGECETVSGTSIWGVETFRDYHMTYAFELAAEVEYERATVWRAALKEARERRYWATRDVMTEGARA